MQEPTQVSPYYATTSGVLSLEHRRISNSVHILHNGDVVCAETQAVLKG